MAALACMLGPKVALIVVPGPRGRRLCASQQGVLGGWNTRRSPTRHLHIWAVPTFWSRYRPCTDPQVRPGVCPSGTCARSMTSTHRPRPPPEFRRPEHGCCRSTLRVHPEATPDSTPSPPQVRSARHRHPIAQRATTSCAVLDIEGAVVVLGKSTG